MINPKTVKPDLIFKFQQLICLLFILVSSCSIQKASTQLEKMSEVELLRELNLVLSDSYSPTNLRPERQEYANRIRAEIIRKHPEWKANIVEAIYYNQAVTGMNRTQVEMVFGHPSRINRSFGAYGSDEQWVYVFRSIVGNSWIEQPFLFVYLRNGLLTGVQTLPAR